LTEFRRPSQVDVDPGGVKAVHQRVNTAQRTGTAPYVFPVDRLTTAPRPRDAAEALPADRSGNRKLVHLQALRGLAASLVVMDHSLERLVHVGALGEGRLRQAYLLGWLGVATFFVISGLIMYRTAADDFGSHGAAEHFFFRRLIRVVPLYWIATFAVVLEKVVSHSGVTLEQLWMSLFFVPYADAGDSVMRPVLGVGWTLNYEMSFYLLFAIALTLPPRWGLRALLLSLPALVALGGLSHSLLHWVDPTTWFDFYTSPLVLLFAAGVALGYLETRAKRWHSLSGPVTVAVALLAVAVALSFIFSVQFPLPVGWQAAFGLLCLGAVAVCTSGRSLATSRLGHVLERAGDASYSTYLFHIFVVVAISETWSRLSLHVPGLLGSIGFLVTVLIAANVVGYVMFRVLEQPLTRTLRRAFQR
jgi:exopolysaccharide production protein ExoZ